MAARSMQLTSSAEASVAVTVYTYVEWRIITWKANTTLCTLYTSYLLMLAYKQQSENPKRHASSISVRCAAWKHIMAVYNNNAYVFLI